MGEYREQYDFTELVLLLLQGEINPEQIEHLNRTLSEDPAKIRTYVELMEIYTELSSAGSVEVSFKANDSVEEYDTFLRLLAVEEHTAPVIEVPREKPQRELIQKVVYPPREKRKISKFGIFMLSNAAAILLVFLFLRFLPSNGGAEVATLTDSINAKWADVTTPMERGTRIATGDKLLLLREGLAKLQFDNKACVIVEAPAEFQVLTGDQIGLNYGKVYSIIPKEAIGFSVCTQCATIIDLGTEFGVQADINGDTFLHVIRGASRLLSGDRKNKEKMDVMQGYAKKVSGVTSDISDIPCDTGLFVRQIESKTKIVWRGQSSLDLADIVGGGNGFGTGHRNVGLNPVAGRINKISQTEANRKADNTYHSVSTHPFIDGVFVPNGQTKQIISSQGHVFKECPVTQGNYFTEISNTPETIDRRNLVLGGVNYSQSEFSALFLHANLGITYDLNAIRSQLGGVGITRFQTVIGISDSAWRPCNADFWILVDGQLRYRREKVQQKGILDTIEIELSEEDRFLTLVTTDGGDPDERVFEGGIVTSIDCDWCLFAQPVLVLE